MTRRPETLLLLGPTVIIITLIVVGFLLISGGSSEADEPTIGLTAKATLNAPDGTSMGTVTFRQTASGVLIMATVERLAPGGHAFIIHEVGACTPDFNAAGDHFNPEDTEHGFIHSSWRRGSAGGHSGDLPNIYAASDGSARADFFTVGITLDRGESDSIFDDNGSAIIVHEKPDAYGEEESDTGNRLACGIIEP